MDPAPPPPGPDKPLPHLLQVELPARYFPPDVGASPIAQQEEEDKIQGAWDSEQKSWEDQPLRFNIDQGRMKEGKEEGSDALNQYHFLDWVAVPASAIAELQIKPKKKSDQTKHLERLYKCLVSCLVVHHAQNSSDVTLAFEDAD